MYLSTYKEAKNKLDLYEVGKYAGSATYFLLKITCKLQGQMVLIWGHIYKDIFYSPRLLEN